MLLTLFTKPFFRALCSTVLLGILFFTPATAADVSAISADPGPTPGDLFQGAVIDAAPSTPARSGFDLRDIFGGQFSTLEPGRTVLADNQGSAVQSIYFHTAAPVTLSGYQLYLGDDNTAGRGASQVEVAVTDASFSSNTVISTVNLVSPYPSAIGENSMRHILVSDSFAPVTGQYFVIRFTPATPNSGVRVMEFDGVAPSGILAATHVDFSAASLPANAWPSGAGQAGFYYGRYIGADSTSGSFDTAQMSVGADPRGGATWNGGDGELTPALGPYFQHPGREPLLSPSLRRYLVGASGETAYTGSVRVVGRFFDFNGGATSVFVAVDSDGDAGPAARDLTYVPATALAGPQQSVTFDFTTDVAPGTTIDFGVLANGSFNSDDTGLVAWIVTGDTAVPTHVVANTYNSTQFFYTHPSQDYRSHAFVQATDGKATAADVDCFDTAPGTGFPYQFAGLLYLENAGSGKATRFDSVRIDVTTGGDFSDTPRLYLLRHNSDPNTSNPAADDRYARLPLVPVRTLNTAGEPSYSFDLSTLSEAESTGYGFAVVGTGKGANFTIAVSEISAVATRVNDTAVIAPQPFFVQWTNDHRYAFTMIRGDWDQVEAEAVSLGGHLLSLNSTEENNFITSTFGFTEAFFIGLRQNLSSPNFSEPAGGFEWVNGDPVTFTNWHGPAFGGSEPNHAFGAGEDYAFMGYFQTPTGTWGDAKKAGFPETSNYRGIIEVDTVSGNLLVNAGGEAAAGAGTFQAIVPIPSWTTAGSFTSVQYGFGAAADLNAADSAALGGGQNYFAGGPGASGTAEQTVDVSSFGVAIDAGAKDVEIAGSFGGYADQLDSISFTATFLDGSSAPLGTLVVNGPSAADRGNESKLLPRSATTRVPSGTRAIRMVLAAERVAGDYTDGYADNLSLVLYPAGTGTKTFYLPAISAKSNIFDAGLASPTQGGVLPPSLAITGLAGQLVTFPKIVGVLNTGVDVHGPDGAHTAGRSCDLTGVGGISGYLNGNNTPALVGVFLGAAQPAQQPERLDFSTSALGENFTLLAPALGQVFFIGDGFTSTGQAQEFIIPAGAERLYFGVPDGNNGTFYHGTPLGYGDNSGSMSLRAIVAPSPTPLILDMVFPEAGGALAGAGGTPGPGNSYTWAIIAGELPPHLLLNADGTVIASEDAQVNGTFTFTVQATDAAAIGLTVQKQFTIVIAEPVAPAPGIVAWWPGDNAVGDIIGNAHVGAASPAYTSGKVGRAFSFNGTSESFATNTRTNPQSTNVLNAGTLTIEAWVKPEVRGDGTAGDLFPANIVCNDKQNFGGIGIGANVFASGSSLWIELQTADPAGAHHRVPGAALTAGQWHHVALVITPGNAKTYLDGDLLESFDYAQGALDGETLVRIGRHNDDAGFGSRRFFKGAIDEATIYHRALSDAEISAIYLADSGGKDRFDAARDFNPVSPQVAGSLWTYGSLPAGAINAGLNSFSLLPTYSVGALLRSWSGSSSVFHNYTGTTYSVNGAGGTEIRIAPGQFGQGPGAGNQYSVARWTAPQAGRYAVSATFVGVDARGVTTDVHVYHKTTALYNDIIASEFLGNGHSYTGTIDAAEGDTVDFILGSNGEYSFDTTSTAASVVYLGQSLAAPAALTIQTAPPATSGRQWFFTATHENDTPGVSLRVQVASANAPNTWTNVGTMTAPAAESDLWTLAVNPLTLVVDNYFFRVVASAPTYLEKASAAFGAEALGAGGTGAIAVLVPGLPPPPPPKLPMPAVTKFIVKVGGKTKVTATHQGTVFDFIATQSLGGVPTLPADTKVRVQYSFTPSVEASWADLPDSRMDVVKKTRTNHTFNLTTSGIPTTDGRPNGEEAIFFRTLTSATGRLSTAGPVVSNVVAPKGPYTVASGPYWRYVVSNHESSSDNSGFTAFSGDTITYNVEFKNDGDGPATDVLVTMLAPKGTTLIAPLTPGADANSTNLVRFSATRAVWLIPSVAPGATVEKSITVRVTAKPYQTVKMLASGITVKCDEIKPVQATPERLRAGQLITTYVSSGLSMRVKATPTIVAAGGTVDYEMKVENQSAEMIKQVAATFRVPIGMSVEYLRLANGSGDFTDTQFPNPSPSSNPSLELYRVDEKQLITWQLGDIPAQTTRTIRFTLRVQFDVPTYYTGSDGVSQTTTLSAREYNVTAKTLAGATIKAFKATPPAANTLLSGDDPVGPPLLSLLKTASADGSLPDTAQPEASPDFSIQVAGVGEVSTAFENSRITYKLRFANKAGAGTGRNVTIHDEIPDGVEFKGWIRRDGVLINSAFGYTFYNKDGLEIPSGGEPFTDLNNNGRADRGEYTDTNGNKRFDAFEDTKFIDINLGMLAAGASGTITYDVAATSPTGTLIFSRSGGAIIPKTKKGQQYEGYSITSENLLVPIAGNPAKLVSMIVAPATFDVQPPVLLNTQGFTPGGTLSVEIPYRVNGGLGLQFENVTVKTSVLKGFNLIEAQTGFVNSGVPIPAAPQVRALRALAAGESVAPLGAPDANGHRPLVFNLGSLAGGRSGVLRVTLGVPAPLPADMLTTQGYLKDVAFLRAEMNGGYRAPLAPLRQRRALSAQMLLEPPRLVPPASGLVGLPVFAPLQARLFVGRTAPLSVERGQSFPMTIFFGNVTDQVSQNGRITMKIPPGTTLTDVGPVTYQYSGNGGSRLERTEFWRTQKLAGGEQSFEIETLDLSPHDVASVVLTFAVDTNFSGNTIEDTSLTAKTPNVLGRAAPKLAIEVRSTNFFTPIANFFGNLLGGIFGNFNVQARDALKPYEASLTTDSRQIGLGGADFVHILNGTIVVPLLGGRSLVVGPSNIVAASEANILTDDGAVRVVVGDDYAPGFEIYGVPNSSAAVWRPGDVIFGLRDAGSSLVAAGGGNLVAAGGLNLVAAGGLNLLDNVSGAALAAPLRPSNANLVAAGGLNLVAAGGGNIVAAGGMNLVAAGGLNLVAAGGGNLVAAGGLNLIGQDGGTLVAAGGGNLVAAGAGNIVAAGGLNLIANDMPKMIGLAGGSLLDAGGGNLSAIKITGLIRSDGAGILSHNGGTIISQNGSALIGK